MEEEWEETEWTLTESERITMVNIKGLDKGRLISRLYCEACGPNLYDEDDEFDVIAANGFGYVECIGNVCFMTDFSGEEANSFYYNYYAQKANLFEDVVNYLRAHPPRK